MMDISNSHILHNRIIPRRANNPKSQFSEEKRFNIATSIGTILDQSTSENCSVSMVYRIDKRVRDTGNQNPALRKMSGQPAKMSHVELTELFWLKS